MKILNLNQRRKMIEISKKEAKICTFNIDEAIAEYQSHTREDLQCQNWELSMWDKGITVRPKQMIYPLRQRGLSTLLSRIRVRSDFAWRLKNPLLLRVVNDLLYEDAGKYCTIRLIDGEIKAVLSSTYGILDDIKILEAIKERESRIVGFCYDTNDRISRFSLTQAGSQAINLGNGYIATVQSIIINSETAESSVWLTTGINIRREMENMTIVQSRLNNLMSRVIHRGNVEQNFVTKFDEFLDKHDERVQFIQDKFRSLMRDDSDEIADIVWERYLTNLKNVSEDLYEEYKDYPAPSSNLDIFLHCLRTAHGDLPTSHKEELNKIAERMLW